LTLIRSHCAASGRWSLNMRLRSGSRRAATVRVTSSDGPVPPLVRPRSRSDHGALVPGMQCVRPSRVPAVPSRPRCPVLVRCAARQDEGNRNECFGYPRGMERGAVCSWCSPPAGQSDPLEGAVRPRSLRRTIGWSYFRIDVGHLPGGAEIPYRWRPRGTWWKRS